MNGAQALIQTLVNSGVDTCFTNPGTSEMHFVAALDEVQGMRALLCLFEGVCTGAADGYGRMLGRPASTLLHLGPGMGNGFANLHNAWRSKSPIVNIVGDHATYHLQYDSPLTSDIEGVAAPFSGWVRTSPSADRISQDTANAITAANTHPGQVATLILPADTAWTETANSLVTPAPPPKPSINFEAVQKIAAIIKRGEPTLLLMSGKAVLDEGAQLSSRIAAATGVQLMCNRPRARMQQGAGRPVIKILAYPVEQGLKQLESFQHIILVETEEPVGFFAYPNLPSRLAPEGCQIHTLAQPHEDGVGALAALADELKIPPTLGPVYELDHPDLPTGELVLGKIWQSLAAQLPEQAILVNESLTSGAGSSQFLMRTPPHDMLFGTGGAIGHGLPQAVGAAVACPDRQVIGLQADGSAMYTIQALWTQARENLNIVTILFNNRTYKTLQNELPKVGAVQKGKKADYILNLDNPTLNFVDIAHGMGVEASRAETAEAFNDQLAAALAKSGPHLIEVMV